MINSQAIINIDSEIVNSVKDWDGGCKMPPFLSETKTDNEIIAIFTAWMANQWEHENNITLSYINDVLKPTPTDFVLNYPICESEKVDTNSFFRLIPHDAFMCLISKLKQIITTYDCVENYFNMRMNFSKKARNVHIALAEMLGGRTFLPTLVSNCTFYRYNLMYYLLAYKYGVWDSIYMDKALLPCCDKTFKEAYRLEITKHQLKSNLENTILLTEIARNNFGDDFYLLHEYLNYKRA